MSNNPKLRTELTTDPLGIGYSGMTDQQAADSLNAETRTELLPVEAGELTEWAMQAGRLARLRDAQTGQTDEVRSLAMGAEMILFRDNGNVDPGNPNHVALINALVSAGVLTAADKTALVDQATHNISRAFEIGLHDAVSLADVRDSRA
jgi:hypothetical protein